MDSTEFQKFVKLFFRPNHCPFHRRFILSMVYFLSLTIIMIFYTTTITEKSYMSFSKKIVFFTSIFIFFIFSLTCVSNLTAEGKTTSPKNSLNILLLTLDTLRPDHLGCYGYKSIKTPNIDKLAQNGVLFSNAYSPAPLTLPSHASIMTGQYPIRHGVHDNGIFVLTDSAVTLAEILKKQGYNTGAILASYVLAAQFGLKQGFDYYNDHFNQHEGRAPKAIESYRKGKEITELAQKWKPAIRWGNRLSGSMLRRAF